MKLGWVLRYLRPQLPPWGEASAFRVQGVGILYLGDPEAMDYKHYDPQQQEGTYGPEEDPEEGTKFQAQMLTVFAPGRVDGEGHTAGNRERGLGQHGGGGHSASPPPPPVGPEEVFCTDWVPL